MSYKRKPKTIDPDEVDPSVYYYDEVYDEMKDGEKGPRDNQKQSQKEDRGAKYIQGLKESADFRKLERDLRKFKSYARDREEALAANKLDDEDVYITSSYKKKLKEMKQLEEEKKRQLEKEEHRSMNFLKSCDTKRYTDRTSHKGKVDKSEGPPVIESTIVETEEHCQTKRCDEEQEQAGSSKAKRRTLKSLEERRVYLRELLAKRTTGKRFEDALQRYIERKALIQR